MGYYSNSMRYFNGFSVMNNIFHHGFLLIETIFYEKILPHLEIMASLCLNSNLKVF